MIDLLFGYISVVSVVLAVLVVTRRNPVHSVLFMLLLFFHLAALYLLQDAEFVAAIQVIVYAGAILVLFLFTVLLLDLREEIREEPYVGTMAVGLAVALGLVLFLVMLVPSFTAGPEGVYTVDRIAAETHTKALGSLLYTEYLLPFELASVVLLVAVVGAMTLAKQRPKEE